MTDTPSRRPGLRDELVAALGQIPVIPPVEHRRAQADNVLALLYREWPWLRTEAEDDDPPLRDQLRAAITALGKSETELAALREVSRGYCPACGRGDAAPSVADWEQQRDRAEQAERERDVARQHAAAIAAQRDRLRQRMNTLADRWDHALAPDKAYARTLRAEISCAPFHGTSTAVRAYRAEGGSQKWAARCWGTDTCDGWLSLDHDTERWAEIARDRHISEDHAEPGPVATQATDSLYDKVADMFSGPLPLPGDVPPATVLPCAWARTRQEHTPHRWQPQPGMRPVQCPGYAQVTADTMKES